MRSREEYSNEINRIGRIGILITLILLFAVPTIMAIVHNAFPSVTDFLGASVGILVIFVPLGISEVFIYSPLLGSASYITFITGNIMNLKVPIATNAQDVANTTKGSEESDVITTLAISVSAMLTIIIIFVGVLLLGLEPVKEFMSTDTVQSASKYILPALFGALVVGILKSTGNIVVRGKVKAGIIPFVLLLVLNIVGISTAGLEGILLIAIIPLTVYIAWILFKKEQITIEIKETEE